MNAKPQIMYFDIRGRAEPIRLLLEFCNVDYVDRQVTLEEWESIRATTPFRRMPVYSEGDLVIPEAFAIINYLGRKYGLQGESEPARVRCDVTIEAWRDYGNRIASVFGARSTNEDARKLFLKEEQPTLLSDLEAFFLARDLPSPYWAGGTPTTADFAAFHLIEGLVNQSPNVLQRFGGLRKFHEHFAALTSVKEYLTSARRPAALFYGPNGKIFPTN